jgi:long-chain fatty acid transport protein
MDMRYKGDLELPQPTPLGLRPVSIPATADLTFPHLLTMGFSLSRYQPFTFNFDVTWTGWSSFGAIDVRLHEPVLFNGVRTKSLVTPRNWHDTWTLRFGMNYRLTEQIKLRAGYTYDMSAIPNATFDPQIVNTDQHIFTVGGDFKIHRFTLGLAYNYLLGEKRSKANFTTTNGVPVIRQADGKYQSTAHGLGFSLAYQF